MDPLRFLCEQDGFFTRAMARELGYDDKAVSQMVRSKVWHRFRRGYYSFTDIWVSSSDGRAAPGPMRAPYSTRSATPPP